MAFAHIKARATCKNTSNHTARNHAHTQITATLTMTLRGWANGTHNDNFEAVC
jgi:hypothetical protein